MGKDTVLVVEDDAAIRDSLQLLLEDEGYNIITAGDGQAALELFPKLPDPTVILLDSRMPKLDGYGVLRDLAAHPDKRDNHPIFLLTAQIDHLSPDMVHLLGSEGIPVLAKPYDAEELLAQVDGAFVRARREQP
jgi:DNA-binding response OmpR family regulator